MSVQDGNQSFVMLYVRWQTICPISAHAVIYKAFLCASGCVTWSQGVGCTLSSLKPVHTLNYLPGKSWAILKCLCVKKLFIPCKS